VRRIFLDTVGLLATWYVADETRGQANESRIVDPPNRSPHERRVIANQEFDPFSLRIDLIPFSLRITTAPGCFLVGARAEKCEPLQYNEPCDRNGLQDNSK
jgi:hypothetical protein